MGMEYQEWGLLLQLNDKREEIVVAENIDVTKKKYFIDEAHEVIVDANKAAGRHVAHEPNEFGR